MSKKILLDDNIKDSIIDLYINHNKSKAQVSDILHITQHTLSSFLKENNIVKSKDDIVNLRKQTNILKYGVDNPSKALQVKRLIGEKNKQNSINIVTKGKKTKLERYGDENYNNIDQGKLTKKIRYNNENYNNRLKCKSTMLEKYGVENAFQLESTIENNRKNILIKNEYTDLFKQLFNDKEKAQAYLKDKNLSYFDLSTAFNAPYYTVQVWATKLGVKDLIKHTFDGKSSYEDEIVDYLHELGITNIIRNSKDILGSQEIDIYLPDFKIGIEFNGTFWHSDLYKTNDYHQKKSLLAESKGIRLIHIYQYEWDNTIMRDKIKSLLRIALGKTTSKIYARQCEVRKISDREAAELNNHVHLQGHRKAHLTYGLFYKGELVQLMSFSKNRKYEWEIIRGCPASNNIVIGGVSKLFSHFVKENNPKEVFSYCDFNKFDGKSYEALGMQFIGYTAPDLKYIIHGQVVNRQPSKYKEIKSQIDARIYGAGSKKFLFKKS